VHYQKRRQCSPSTSILVMAILTARAFAQSDPFQSNPGPAAPAASKPALHLPPEREPVVVAPQPPPAAVSNFDGNWAGTYTCGPTLRGDASFVQTVLATVREGHMELVRGQQGNPASFHIDGLVGTSGAVKLLGEGISNLPGVPHNPFAIVLDGSFEAGGSFRAHGLHGKRTCDLVLGRVAS
jgi:hypothetical protein